MYLLASKLHLFLFLAKKINYKILFMFFTTLMRLERIDILYTFARKKVKITEYGKQKNKTV